MKNVMFRDHLFSLGTAAVLATVTFGAVAPMAIAAPMSGVLTADPTPYPPPPPTPGGSCSVSASLTDVVAGTSVTVSGSGYPAATFVTVSLDGGPGTSTKTGSSGAFSVTLTVPAGIADGSHSISAGTGGTVCVTSIITHGVDAQTVSRLGGKTVGVATSAQGLSSTGVHTAEYVLIGAALVAAGGGLVVVGRRRS